MMNFTEIKKNTKKAAEMIADTARDLGSIYQAYGRCSANKVRAWQDIKERAEKTPGYNNDLHLCSKSTSFFTTVYTYTDGGKTYIVKDTPTYVYRTELA